MWSSILLLTACGTNGSVTVPTGTWGGRNIGLEVSASGASAQFKCGATGQLDGGLSLDDAAHFAVSGTYEPKLVTGGPRSAQYRGSLNGGRMSLTVQVGADVIGSFELTQDQPGSFEVCNF